MNQTLTRRDELQNAIDKIQTGNKYTLFGLGEFGFANSTQTVIEKVYIDKYAQYDHVLYIVHRPKRKRTSYKKIILPYQELYIFDGWIDINNRAAWNIEEKENMTIQSSKYTCFDKRNITDTLNTVGINPIAIIEGRYT